MARSGAITPPVTTRKSTSKAGTPPIRQAPLGGKARHHLRSLGHGLEIVLHVGKTGISDALVEELERALQAHELVKIRLLRECPVDKLDAAVQLAARTGAEHVQTVGSVLLLYRERPEKPAIELSGGAKAVRKHVASGKSKAHLRHRVKPAGRRRSSRVHSAEGGPKTKRARPARAKGAAPAEHSSPTKKHR